MHKEPTIELVQSTIPKICEIEVIYKRPPIEDCPKVTSSKDATNIFRTVYNPLKIDLKEYFYVMLLSQANQVLGVSHISIGSTSATIVNVKEIFQVALRANASAIIVSHNHPSGALKASESDKRITNKIASAGEVLDIKLLDHIILTSEGHYSMADEGQL